MLLVTAGLHYMGGVGGSVLIKGPKIDFYLCAVLWAVCANPQGNRGSISCFPLSLSAGVMSMYVRETASTC